jgi:hypothetical protein
MYASFYIKKVWLQVKAIARAAAAGLAEQGDGVHRKEILLVPGRRCLGGFCDVRCTCWRSSRPESHPGPLRTFGGSLLSGVRSTIKIYNQTSS